MIKNNLKKGFTVVLAVMAAFFVAVGFFVGENPIFARAEDGVDADDATTVAYPVKSVSGGIPNNCAWYTVWLESDVEFESEKTQFNDVKIYIDGVEKNATGVNDKEAKKLGLVIPFEQVSKDEKVLDKKVKVLVKKGTAFDNYVIAEDYTAVLNKGSVESMPASMEFSLQKKDGKIRSSVQEGDKRYCIYIQTNISGLTDKMWRDGEEKDVCVFDKGTANQKEVRIYYVGGIVNAGAKDKTDYDGTAILAILNYDDIVKGATTSSEIGKHSITIEKDYEFKGNYVLAKEFTFYIGNEQIAENESDIEDLPEGTFKGSKTQSVDFESQKIEDYIAESSVVKLKANAKKDTDGNIVLESGDVMDYCKSVKMIGSKAEPQIKFRSTYDGGDVYLVFEIRSKLDNGNYWLSEGAPTVRLRYNEARAESERLNDCLYFDFFNDGLHGTPQFVIYNNEEFTLEKGDFFVEFGAVEKTDSRGYEGFVFYVKVTQGDKVAYGECVMTGDFNSSDSGDVAIYISPYETTELVDLKEWKGGQVVKDSVIKSVDKTRVIDGVTTNIGAMSFYNPKISRAENADEYDISDLVPIGDGVTYTKIEGNTEDSSQSMINAVGVSVKNGGYSVKMRIKFTGDDFGLTFAFRGQNTLAKSGYKLVIADNVVIVGSMQAESPFKPNTEYDIEVGCVDYYIADERVASGTIVYLKVGDQTVVEDSIDKLSGLGTYFCALIEGGGGSKVTITSAKAKSARKAYELKTKANKTVLANGKKATLSYDCNQSTGYDKVSYEVVKGSAHIDGDGLYSETDGEITVRVKIENEFGTFYGEELTINEGMGSEDSGSGTKSGCGGGVSAAVITLPFVAIATMLLRKKKQNG